MKTTLTFVLALILSVISVTAQQSINYKALIKDGFGNMVANQGITVQFQILKGDGMSLEYQETHTPTTDANGIVIANIGEGTTSDVFTDIDWGADDHYLNVQINTGGGLTDMGTTQFMAVPYALSSSDNYWTKNGNAIYTLDDVVGINRMNPEHTLDVRVPSNEDAASLNVSNQDKNRYLRLISGSSMFPDPSFTWAPGRSLLFASFDDNSIAFTEYMRISSIGNVGIGTINPLARLDVNGGEEGIHVKITSTNGNAILAESGGGSSYAGYFSGRVHVAGVLSKSSGSFKIDHPLDPENKYLSHSFVESPDMMNIYNGNVNTDKNGNAIVELPNYFEALNMDFRYQLTVIGQFAQAIVFKKIKGNSFEIKTDKPNVEVSWQVTGVRNDSFARKNRIKVEEEKEAENIGKYLNPEAFSKNATGDYRASKY